MSSKSTKTGKKLSVPRELKVIQQEYQQKCAEAGMLQYQISVQQEQLATTNEYLKKLNYEAAARNQLDKEAGVKAEIKEVISAAN